MNLARTVMDQLVKTGHVERAVMGISIHDARQEDAERWALKQIGGVVVDSYTSDDSPPGRPGIQPGDVIVAVGRAAAITRRSCSSASAFQATGRDGPRSPCSARAARRRP